MSIPLWDECAWASSGGESSPMGDDAIELSHEPIFACDPDLNAKIYLHLGAGYKIPCDACVIGQNEQLDDKSGENAAIYALAGPTLEEELLTQAPIQTGESVITTGGTLPCEWLVHAVAPRYDERYLTASDHALFSAYKGSLLLAAEKQAKSIVLTCIYSKRKKYPRFDAAHVALRTVRKFLQHPAAHCFERVMFCVPDQDDYDIYSTLLCAYFPRSKIEVESQASLLPTELGDEWGEIIITDRVLKVSVGPKPLPQQSLEEYRKKDVEHGDSEENSATNKRMVAKTGNKSIIAAGEVPTDMTSAGVDKDEERKAKIAREFAQMSRVDRMKLKFQVMLEELESDSLEDMQTFQFVNIVGQDRDGRSVVLITATNLQIALSRGADLERILLCFMKVMEPLRCRPFVLVYANSSSTAARGNMDSSMEEEVTLSIFDLFTARYKENLQQLYILHASFFFRMYLWVALPFLATPFWKNYICVANLQQLDRYMEINKLELPAVVKQYDKTLY